MDILPVQHYVDVIIPNIERELCNRDLPTSELLELYKLYEEILLLTARDNFHSFNKYLEFDEDKTIETKGFYHHRKHALKELFDSMNDMEMNDKYDLLLISIAPRIGKTTSGIRFLSWICGRHPESTEMATSYSDNITTSFYSGMMEIVSSDRFAKIFHDAPLVNQNAKREEIWLRVVKRYPSITFVAINGSMTGRCEAGKYLYCDDLVSGIEEAMSIVRLNKLWQTYEVNCKQRKKDGCKEIHVATRWSVHDVISKLTVANEDNPRCKIINIDCFDEDGESNFSYLGGFSTKYYKDLQDTMDELSFNALYRQDPIEREGLLYNKDEVPYYLQLPDEKPDTIVAICDSKNMGKDYVSSPIGYVYGDFVYIEDVVYNSSLPDITKGLVANKWLEHKVVRADVELNNGGNYYAEGLDDIIKSKGGHTSIRIFFTSNNKTTKIITYSDYVKKHFIFRDPSTYSSKSEYAKFMKDLFSWTQTGKNSHDDAPDSIAMLAQMVQELAGNVVKIISRKALGM